MFEDLYFSFLCKSLCSAQLNFAHSKAVSFSFSCKVGKNDNGSTSFQTGVLLIFLKSVF